MSAIRIPRSRSKFPFMDSLRINLHVTGGETLFDVRRHEDAACPVAEGDIEECDDSGENPTCATGSKAGVLCQDHVRETT